MKLAFPVKNDNGLESEIYEHFGKAPEFIIVDSKTKKFSAIQNKRVSEGKTSCKASIITNDIEIDAVITTCIGDGSLRNLSSQNIKVYQESFSAIHLGI